MSKYNSYHTYLVLLHHFDALSIDYKSIIPASTLSNWKRKNVTDIICCNSLTDNDVIVLKEIAKNKKLLRAAKALYILFQVISRLFNNTQNKAELLKINKPIILDTNKKFQPTLVIKRILKSLTRSIYNYCN